MSVSGSYRNKQLALLCGVLFCCVAASLPVCESTNPATLTVLHTNDLHSRPQPDASGRGGVANVTAYARKVRAERDNVLFLIAGNMTQGSPVSTVFQGKPLFEFMSVMGYDAATFGNHEFDEGPDLVFDYREIACLPIVSANVFSEGKQMADGPFVVKDFDGVRVAVLGITTQSFTPPPLEF